MLPMNDETRKNNARHRLGGLGAEIDKVRSNLKALEHTRDLEILSAVRDGLTQQEVADLLHLTKGRVSQIVKELG